MRVLIINNLASGRGDGKIYQFVRHLVEDGDEVVMRCTSGATDMRTFLKDGSSFDLVVACGGDGTQAMVNYELRYSDVPILPFPAGTANLLTTNNLHSPADAKGLALLARNGKTLDFDLAEMTVGGKTFGFNIIAGSGYDAVIMEEAKPNKKIMGSLAYVGAALANVMPTVSHFVMDLDGKRVESDGIGVMVVNFAKIKFDLAVTHENTPRDGYLDVVVMKADNVFELLPAVGSALLDLVIDSPDREGLEIYHVKEATIAADPPLPVQFDGESSDLVTPFNVRVLPHATRLVVSEKGYEVFTGRAIETNIGHWGWDRPIP